MNNIIRWDPFSEINTLQQQIADSMWPSLTMQTASPNIDVYTLNDQLVVEAYLPHFEQKDLSVHIEPGALVINAQRTDHIDSNEKQYIVREQAQSYYRRIGLPEDAEMKKVRATFDKSVLQVMIPLSSRPKSQAVPITSGKPKEKALQ